MEQEVDELNGLPMLGLISPIPLKKSKIAEESKSRARKSRGGKDGIPAVQKLVTITDPKSIVFGTI